MDASSETTTRGSPANPAAATATADTTSSSAGPTFLGQEPAPSPAPAQPGDKPTPPPQGDPPKPQENGGEDGEEAPPDEAAYATLKVGDGLVADDAALGDFKKLAAEARLPVETAQRLLDLHGQMQSAAMRGWQSTVQGWKQQTEADPYLSGGDIPNGGFASLDDAGQAAGRFMARYGDTELRQVLNAYGLGEHPALVRAIAKAGRDLASDQLHAGTARPRIDPNRARYPSMSDEFFPH